MSGRGCREIEADGFVPTVVVTICIRDGSKHFINMNVLDPSNKSCEVGTVPVPILQMKLMRLREFTTLV